MAVKLRIGSRGSALALAQANLVLARLKSVIPDLDAEIVEIHTTGDKLQTASLAQVGGKGLFIRELETALQQRTIDIAVHSMKDLPAALPRGFRLVSVPEREDTRDALVTRDSATLAALPAGTRLGTSSTRRRFQALRVNPRLAIAALRGNVNTRLERVADGQLDAIIVAMAGLKRLGRLDQIKYQQLDENDFIPAGGQGALAVEAIAGRRVGDSFELEQAMTAINNDEAFYETAAERAFLATIGASCVTPVGVRGTIKNATLTLRSILFSPDGTRELSDSLDSPVEFNLSAPIAAAAGQKLATQMLARGAAELVGNA